MGEILNDPRPEISAADNGCALCSEGVLLVMTGSSYRTRRSSAKMKIKTLRRTLRTVTRQARMTVDEDARITMQISILQLHREIQRWTNYISNGCPVTKSASGTMF